MTGMYGENYPEVFDPGPAENPAVDEALEQHLAFNREVQDEFHRLKVRKAARERLRIEERAPAPPFDIGTLGDILARPRGPRDRVVGLVPADAALLTVAQRKTGKTTLALNLTRCLLTGEALLGRFDVVPVIGRVAILNYEVSGDTLARWADEVGVFHDRFVLVNLRGRRNPLADPDDRARLAEHLQGFEVETLIVDPFGRAYTGRSQNDPGEVGAWLAQLDEFARSDVGARDLILSAHAGWNGERTRGASALEDWADVTIMMTRDPDDETKRFLRAEGRDVLVEEDALTFDPSTRLLTLARTGSRKHAREERKIADLAVLVVRAARIDPGLSYAAAERSIRAMDDNPGFRAGEVAKAARWASEHGSLHIGTGQRGGAALTATDHLSPPLPTPSRETTSTSPTSPYRGEVDVEVRWDSSTDSAHGENS